MRPAKVVDAAHGGLALYEADLRAHLAALLRLDNVGLAVGSGASVGVGGKTLDAVWTDLQLNSEASAGWLEARGFGGAGVDVEQIIDALEIAHLEWKRVNDTDLQFLAVGPRPHKGDDDE
jgi:hypothetical protein